MRSVVVLPQPEGPSSVTSVPGSIVNDTSSTAANCAVALADAVEVDAAGAVLHLGSRDDQGWVRSRRPSRAAPVEALHEPAAPPA